MSLFQTQHIWSNYSDLTRPISPKWWFSKGNFLFQGNLGWLKIIIWPDIFTIAGTNWTMPMKIFFVSVWDFISGLFGTTGSGIDSNEGGGHKSPPFILPIVETLKKVGEPKESRAETEGGLIWCEKTGGGTSSCHTVDFLGWHFWRWVFLQWRLYSWKELRWVLCLLREGHDERNLLEGHACGTFAFCCSCWVQASQVILFYLWINWLHRDFGWHFMYEVLVSWCYLMLMGGVWF